ncbi:hypothetical protein BB561_005906 [Smittium simulii]|uniref:Uncharacterized protein n=1 Tax=Smittium simulii TaxID=133385 RepID=A0A2T9Y7S5_9FUNG|nr:hypothetical protein BB561_005906 [Smittium simulii]
MSYFNLHKQYVKYGEYHSHPTNVIQHQIFVPLILWSMFGFMSYTNPIVDLPIPAELSSYIIPNYSLLMLAVYSVYYIILDPAAGLMYFPILAALLASATYVAHQITYGLLILSAVHVVSWVIQVNGHYVYEKRAPALLDNLPQAFLMAPFFVFLEGLFALGYRKEFHAAVNADITHKVREFHKAKQS